MNSTIRLFSCAALACLATLSAPAADNTLTSAEKADGWKLLFDGKTLDGWREYGSHARPDKGWKVEDGLLKKLSGVHGGDIITEQKYGDFELQWDWLISKAGNNGIKYLVTEERKGAPGHEYQLLDDVNHPDGRIGPIRQTASFYDVFPPAADKPLNPPGQWNHSRILVKGNHVEHWLNGKKVLEYTLGSPELKAAIAKSKFKNAAGFADKIDGYIMITDHHEECWFKNIKIRVP